MSLRTAGHCLLRPSGFIIISSVSEGLVHTCGMAATRASLSAEDRALVLRALRYARGRYSAERAQQLSAVPSRTLHDWATSGVLVPDWFAARPRGWSYRDIVYARLLAWLRSKHMERRAASERVAHVRKLLSDSAIDPSVHSDGTIFLIGNESTDRFTGQQAFDGLVAVLDVFELTEPIEGVSRGELWGPSLVRPSAHTYISPWVLAGEPCVEGSRVPSSTMYALATERGLDAVAIHRLYESLSVDAIEDAVALEARLRAA
jgi:uncharacterized protein (DUF433 family)